MPASCIVPPAAMCSHRTHTLCQNRRRSHTTSRRKSLFGMETPNTLRPTTSLTLRRDNNDWPAIVIGHTSHRLPSYWRDVSLRLSNRPLRSLDYGIEIDTNHTSHRRVVSFRPSNTFQFRGKPYAWEMEMLDIEVWCAVNRHPRTNASKCTNTKNDFGMHLNDTNKREHIGWPAHFNGIACANDTPSHTVACITAYFGVASLPNDVPCVKERQSNAVQSLTSNSKRMPHAQRVKSNEPIKGATMGRRPIGISVSSS